MADEDPARKAAAFLYRKLPSRPRAAVVLGSGMGELDLGRVAFEIPYARIPGFPRARVAGHPGRLALAGDVAVLRGRSHFYEGCSMEEVVRPVRILARLGVEAIVLTNAAGAVNPRFRPGEVMIISDHLNLMGENPLRGGPDFLDLTQVYDAELQRRVLRHARLPRGVYAAVPGPSFETPAEVRMLRTLGADAVGMSTVPEAIAARQAGMRVLGLSLLANRAAGLSARPITHEDVLEAGRRARDRMAALLKSVLSDLG